MKRATLCAAFFGLLSTASAQIANVTQANGDADRPISWTGQVLNGPVASVTWNNYTVGTFGEKVPIFTDRVHTLAGITNASLGLPNYLVGGQYIMTANDNRDNPTYSISLTLNQPAYVYMLIDNRGGLNDNNAANPPSLDLSTNSLGLGFMTWVLDNGFQGKVTGVNRLSVLGNLNLSVPDEVAIDESNNGTLDNYFSVYARRFGAGTVTLGEMSTGGRNMYGVVVTTIPEPSTLTILGLAAGLLVLRRKK